jgi:hypothetical protein
MCPECMWLARSRESGVAGEEKNRLLHGPANRGSEPRDSAMPESDWPFRLSENMLRRRHSVAVGGEKVVAKEAPYFHGLDISTYLMPFFRFCRRWL